jgi:sortase (surface protein transpeptidase)
VASLISMSHHMRRFQVIGLAVVGVILGVVAGSGFLSAPSDSGDAAAVERNLTAESESVTTTTTAPTTTTTVPAPLWSANEISLLADLETTSGPRPERLVIDALRIDAPVGEYGVAANGQMDVPNNITEVGWYKFGPSPGEPGSAVLAAHVDLAGPGRGLFYDLGELEEGDEVSVGYDDGTTRRFRVVARTTYLKSELPLEAIFSRGGDPVLTLVTCGGGFSRSTGSYDSNVVVYAVPVDSPRPDETS